MTAVPNASADALPTPAYVVGGTLPPDSPRYLERRADKSLYEALLRHDFCYVLNTRQMGKSSLMARTAQRLAQTGRRVAIVDLTAIGLNLSPEQWYLGLLTTLANRLGKRKEMLVYWKEHAALSPLQRFLEGIVEVALPDPPGQEGEGLTIFIDEIDALLSLPFSGDEFMVGLRQLYNLRAENPALSRLSFCILGVATPSDLVRDTRVSPFNIGQRIKLEDFTPEEAAPFADGLGTNGSALLSRILYWTGGNPFLTQRLCAEIATRSIGDASSPTPNAQRLTPASVDSLVRELYLSHRAKESDDNLAFVRNRLLHSEGDRAAVLTLYSQVRSGNVVPDAETDPLCSLLKLSGIARSEGARLVVRNRIYREAFDRKWIEEQMPSAELRRQRAAYRLGILRAAWVGGVISIALAVLTVVVTVVVYQRAVYGSMDIYPLLGDLTPGKTKVKVKGKLIAGADFYLKGKFDGRDSDDVPIPNVKPVKNGFGVIDPNEVLIDLPSGFKTFEGKLVVKRNIPLLSALLPSLIPRKESNKPFTIYDPPEVSGFAPPKSEVGSTFNINGKNLKRDQLLMDGKPAAVLVVAETEGGLQVKTPDKPGAHSFSIKFDGSTEDAGWVIVVPAVPVVATPGGNLMPLAPGESVPTVDGKPLPVVKVGDKTFVKMPAGIVTITTVKNGKTIEKLNNGGAPPHAYKNEDIFPVFLKMVDEGAEKEKVNLTNLEKMMRSRDATDPVFNLVMGSIDWREPKKNNLADFWFIAADNSIDKISTPVYPWNGLLDAERGFRLVANDPIIATEWLEKALRNYPKYLKANVVLVQIYARYLNEDPMGKNPNGIENLKAKANALLKRMDDSGITDAIKAKYTGDELDKIVAILTTIRNTVTKMK